MRVLSDLMWSGPRSFAERLDDKVHNDTIERILGGEPPAKGSAE